MIGSEFYAASLGVDRLVASQPTPGDDHVDFNAKDHHNQQQEKKRRDHLQSPDDKTAALLFTHWSVSKASHGR